MQTGKKSSSNTVNPDNIAKVAEIISLIEEAHQTKHWIFKQIKRNHLKLPVKHSMNIGNKDKEFDVVVSTLPLPIFAKIARETVLKESGLENLDKISYQGVICAVVVSKKQFTKFYWNNILDDDIVFSGIIEHTNFIDKSKYGNHHLAYLFNYVSKDDPLWKMSDEQIRIAYTTDLLKLFPFLTKSDIEGIHVSRTMFATPRFTKDYIANVPCKN